MMVSSAVSKNVSGTVSGSRMPVISPTTSFRLSRCCTLIVVKTSMPRGEQLVDVLPALRVARARRVGVREVVDEDHFGMARERRVEVELAGAAAVGSAAAISNAVERARRSRRSVHIDHADDDVAARFAHALRGGEHRVGLAGARETRRRRS